jgi:UDP-N-acetylglucosamine--N-acetylmuramyl-(pentapeptide) pyrophosphoryl-undecaprenol N-acetylglucosamine transferase
VTFAIAAAGTGGHVYPGLAVGEALVELGVDRSEILYVGGQRLASRVYPEAGFPYLGAELRGLSRRFTAANLGIPRVVLRAERAMRNEFQARDVTAVLGMGGYVTVPAGLAARRLGLGLAIAEQNAEAGLANRFVSRFARRVFTSFPSTAGLAGGEWVGNPIRRHLADFDRASLRPRAGQRWDLDPEVPVVGVFGGSLGAGAVNSAVIAMLGDWEGLPIQVLHLAGQGYEEVVAASRVSDHHWVVLDFCDVMDEFYAACDLVVARAGGSVAELTATATPAVLVPGGFGSTGHQAANAAALARVGAAIVVAEDRLSSLGGVVAGLVADPGQRERMAEATTALARPQAARTIAAALFEVGSS